MNCSVSPRRAGRVGLDVPPDVQVGARRVAGDDEHFRHDPPVVADFGQAATDLRPGYVAGPGNAAVVVGHVEMNEVIARSHDGGGDVLLLHVHVEGVEQDPDAGGSGVRRERRRLRGGVHQVGLEAVDRLDAQRHVVAFQVGVERREGLRRPLRPFGPVGRIEDAPRRVHDTGETSGPHGGRRPHRPSQVLEAGGAHLGVGRGDVGLARQAVRAGHLETVVLRQSTERIRLLVGHAEHRDLDTVEAEVGHRAEDRGDLVRPAGHPQSGVNSELHCVSP